MAKTVLPLSAIRKQFPSFQRKHNGKPLIFIDGPAGTQMPRSVIDGIVHYYENSNANTEGMFITTNETDATIKNTRLAMATLLGAESWDTISLGQNMTTLNYALARGMSRFLRAGDEVLITQLDHEANRGPWLTLRDFGINVREINLLPTGTLDYADFASKMNEKTRLVCMGMSSNCIGTVNNIKLARELTYKYGALLLLDAVHYAPHFAIDVQKIGCDFLICSAYKFYGPHVGILYSRQGLLDRIPTDRLRTNHQAAPFCIETGTLNHAALAGVIAAVEFIASLGNGKTQREKIVDAYSIIAKHEHELASRLYSGLKRIKGVTIIGQDFSSDARTPTVSFVTKGKRPEEVCAYLASKNICAWDGHFYALRAMEILGIAELGGVTRMGISVYNTKEEIDFVIEKVREAVG